MRKLTTNEFVDKANKIHNNEYNYSKSIYKNRHSKIEIICNKCYKSFWQTSGNHLCGKGCPKCAIVGEVPKTKEKFIEDAQKIHKNIYDYSKVNYVTTHVKIEIVCPKHGVFRQSPEHHLRGNKCPRCVCKISNPEIEFLDYLKIPNTQNNRQVRILDKRVDGFDLNTNTIYEFLGNYYHGNPEKFNHNDYNQTCHKTFGKLYKETFDKFSKFKDLGYNIQYIWESDWKKFKKKETDILSIISF